MIPFPSPSSYNVCRQLALTFDQRVSEPVFLIPQAIIMIAKSVTYFISCEHFLTPEKTFPVNQFRSRERRKLHFRESNFTNFSGRQETKKKMLLRLDFTQQTTISKHFNISGGTSIPEKCFTCDEEIDSNDRTAIKWFSKNRQNFGHKIHLDEMKPEQILIIKNY